MGSGTGTRADHSAEIREEFAKSSNWMVVFGAALVVVHLLNISPSEVDALGTKVVLRDPIILRGALAILFLHHFHAFAMNGRIFGAYRSFDEPNRQIARAMFRKYRKPKRSVRTTKRMARIDMTLWILAYIPYGAAFVLLFVSALVLSVTDVYRFAEYCYEHTAAGHYLQQEVIGAEEG